MKIKLFNIGGKVKPLAREFKTLQYKRRLAYLESTGTQWIDTKILPKADSFGFDVKFRCTKYTNANSAILGARENTTVTSSWYYIQAASSRLLRLPILGAYGFTHAIPVITQNDVEISYRPTELIVNGTPYAVSGKTDCDRSFWLFTFNNEGSPYSPVIDYRLLEFTAYDNDKIIQHLIPVIDNDDIPCMYDEVSGQFLYNQGTGTFLYGEL